MKKLLAFVLAALMLLGAAGISQADSIREAAAYAGKTQKVTITTKDPYTGDRVGNVTLMIYDKDGKEIMKARTAENGRTTVNLKPGSYQVGITKAPKGYTGVTIKQVKVKKGQKTYWTVRACPQFTCKVKVLDDQGKPVQGATVRICTNTAVTSKNGIANVKKVAYGSYDVSVLVKADGKTYIPYSKKWTLKAGSGETVRKTIRLPEKSEWLVYMQTIVKKPVIYLYSKEEKNVNVSLGKPEDITASYPAYPEGGWNVTVHPDGSMTDTASGRALYSLYWEGEARDADDFTTGFAVEGKDTAAFLEEKLAYLGLTEREAEEFIIYWLPVMQENDWNLIRFVPEEEINACMPLTLTPAADRVLRIWMEFTPLEEKPEGVEEQELVQVNRAELEETDFCAVEWGGMEY